MRCREDGEGRENGASLILWLKPEVPQETVGAGGADVTKPLSPSAVK